MHPAGAASAPGSVSRAGWAALLGGLMWIPYGILELTTPFGPDTVFDPARGHDTVVDRGLFALYSAPGAVAVALCAAALIGLRGPSRAGTVLAVASLALGALSALGIALDLDPLFTASRVVGTLALGVATWLVTAGALPRAARAALAAGGAGLLALWPLVFAVESMTAEQAAAVIAVYGGAWALVGARLLGGRALARRASPNALSA